MATQSKRGAVNVDSQAKAAYATQLAGMASAFGEAIKLGPQVLTLQQALVAGMGRSQEREAERLRKRHGDQDPRVADAAARAASYGELKTVVDGHAQAAARIAETFTREGLFHGYVALPDASPAQGHTVRLSLERDDKSGFHGSAETDARGYFCIDLGVAREPKKEAAQDVINRWSQRVARALGPVDGTTQAKAAAERTEPTSAQTVRSQVSVLDPTGRLVFEDPLPPTFDSLPSEFRYYVVGAATKPQTDKAYTKK